MNTILSRRRRARARNAQRGLTLLEIMIVIAILGLVMGLVVVPKVMGMFGESTEKIAKLAVDKFAFESYPQWSLANSDKGGCPPDLLTVAQHVGKSEADTKDPWGTSYKLLCGPNLPAGVKTGIAVMSFGPDMQEGTPDDVKSW